MENVLMATDCYKMSHMIMNAPGTDFVHSYLCARSDRYFEKMVFFGLQYFLDEYLARGLQKYDDDGFLEYKRKIVGRTCYEEEQKIKALVKLGYWPVEIRALPEGLVLPTKNALYTIKSTHPEFPWVVGFIESLLLKVWYPCTVATTSMHYRDVVDKFTQETGGLEARDFMVHDFGYRSDSSEESAAISGAAHLISFVGSDTVPAYPFIDSYYRNPRNDNSPIMLSVPASEHSVMCSYGADNEMSAYEELLKIYPDGYLSIVSDTYSIWNVCQRILPALKSKIMQRQGKVVIRPDSGNPPDIICGDPKANVGTPEEKGVLRLLAEEFGTTTNVLGYKELDSHIGLIYGDGMYLERYTQTLERMKAMGFAASNLVIGCGGILRQGTRDTLGMALKATHVRVNGVPRDIIKTPVTDPGKRSHTGFIRVIRDPADGVIKTLDQQPEELCGNSNDLLQPVFRDGKLLRRYSFSEVRNNYRNSR